MQNAIAERLIGSIRVRVWITPRSPVHDGRSNDPRYNRTTTCARMAGEPMLSASEVSLTQALLPLEDEPQRKLNLARGSRPHRADRGGRVYRLDDAAEA